MGFFKFWELLVISTIDLVDHQKLITNDFGQDY